MRIWIAAAGALLIGASITAQACDNPPLVNIPAKDQINAKNVGKVNAATTQYFNAMKEYVACLQTELTAAGGDNAPSAFRNVMIHRNNAAVAEEQAVENWYKNNVGDTKPEEKGGKKHKR